MTIPSVLTYIFDNGVSKLVVQSHLKQYLYIFLPYYQFDLSPKRYGNREELSIIARKDISPRTIILQLSRKMAPIEDQTSKGKYIP